MAGDRRSVEIEIGGRTLALVGGALVVLAAAVGFFVWHRAPAGAAAGAARTANAPATGPVEDIGGRASLFDREGTGGATRDGALQVTPEAGRPGTWEIDLGTAASRPAAETLRNAAREGGVEALVALDPAGRYRVVGGPFATEAEAQRAAARLAARLGHVPAVRAR